MLSILTSVKRDPPSLVVKPGRFPAPRRTGQGMAPDGAARPAWVATRRPGAPGPARRACGAADEVWAAPIEPWGCRPNPGGPTPHQEVAMEPDHCPERHPATTGTWALYGLLVLVVAAMIAWATL